MPTISMVWVGLVASAQLCTEFIVFNSQKHDKISFMSTLAADDLMMLGNRAWKAMIIGALHSEGWSYLC